MSHEITEREDGTAEAGFALTPAWHGLGAVLDHPMTSAEALAAAQLDWRVEQFPAGVQVNLEYWRFIPGMAVNVRTDTGLVLGTVSQLYKVIQNVDAFAFLDGLIADHEMSYESAFSLSGGRKVVLLGRLPKVDQVAPGDNVLRYVLLSLHHDGAGAIRFGPTAVRVVCANTYALALDRGGIGDMKADQFSHEVAIRHMGDVKAKLDQAKAVLTAANQQFDEHAAKSRELTQRRLTGAEWDEFLDLMCPHLDPHDPDWTQRRANQLDTTRAAIRDAYSNPRQTLDGIAHTAWAAYNAVVEHIDHLPRRGATPERRAEARFNVCLYGAGRDMKKRAFETACRFAAVVNAG